MRAFFVAGTPVPKARARVTRSGHAFTPKRTVLAEQAVRDAYLQAWAGHAPLCGPVSVTILCTFPIPKSWSRAKREAAKLHTIRPDLDNLCKTVTDALNGHAYVDDSQVCELRATKSYTHGKPGLHISIREVE